MKTITAVWRLVVHFCLLISVLLAANTALVGRNLQSFTIPASPSSLTVVQGNQGNSNITTTITGGFNSGISLSASGMPSGTKVSFNPQTIAAPGGGNSAMTIAVGGNTPPGPTVT